MPKPVNSRTTVKGEDDEWTECLNDAFNENCLVY